jgi:hypothetical protein
MLFYLQFQNNFDDMPCLHRVVCTISFHLCCTRANYFYWAVRPPVPGRVAVRPGSGVVQ